MNGADRIFVRCVGATSAQQLWVARAADWLGIDGIWIDGMGAVDGDSFASTLATTVAMSTRDLRVGVVLRLEGPEQCLRLVEDLGVLDQCSSGRAEAWIAAPGGSASDDWRARARVIVDDQRRWSLADGRILPVRPGPIQPMVPVVIDAAALEGTAPASGSRAAVVVDPWFGSIGVPAAPSRVVARVPEVVTSELLGTAEEAASLALAVTALRSRLGAVGAVEVVFDLARPSDLERLASALVPLLRATDSEVHDLAHDVVFAQVEIGR